MASTNRSDTASEPVLPTSRQPMPGSETYRPPEPRKRGGDGDESGNRRSAAEIEAEIQQATERLAANVDRLAERMSPRQTARRWATGVTRLSVTESGLPRPELVGAVVGGLLGLGFLLWRARKRS